VTSDNIQMSGESMQVTGDWY